MNESASVTAVDELVHRLRGATPRENFPAQTLLGFEDMLLQLRRARRHRMGFGRDPSPRTRGRGPPLTSVHGHAQLYVATAAV